MSEPEYDKFKKLASDRTNAYEARQVYATLALAEAVRLSTQRTNGNE